MGSIKSKLENARSELAKQAAKMTREVIQNPDAPVVYSNSADLHMSMTDFRIRLGEILQADPDAGKLVVKHLATVFLAPVHAKELAGILSTQVKKYEDLFGPIPSK